MLELLRPPPPQSGPFWPASEPVYTHGVTQETRSLACARLKQFRFTHESPEPDVWGFSTVRYRCAFVTGPRCDRDRPGPALHSA